MNDAANVENGVELPTIAELFGTDEYNNSRGNGDITGGEIPAELWHDFTMGALRTLPPCEELPTERPQGSQQVFGLELLTTLLHCVEPDPSVTTTDTSVPEESTTTTVPGDTTSSTDTTATTQPPSTETTTTQPPTTESTETTQAGAAPGDGGGGGGDEEAVGLFGFRPVNYASSAGLLPLNNQQPQTTVTQPPQTAPPTTEPCIPIDLDGNPLTTTVPVPGSATPAPTAAPDQGGDG